MSDVIISRAAESDFDAICSIFQQVTATGDSYIYPEDFTGADIAKWMEGSVSYVAKIGKEVVGIYLIRQNRIGRGSHVCNAAYMVSPAHQGKKIGRMMGKHSLVEAKKLGYLAMQFNIVVSTNSRAVHLWKSLGFKIIGVVPKAFNHKEKGLVDAYIMHQFL